MNVFAQETNQKEKRMAAGLALELNMNSRENFAGGLALGFDYNLPVAFAPLTVGLVITGSSGLLNNAAIESAALFRWYFQGEAHTSFFVQAETGLCLFIEEGDTHPLFLGGLRNELDTVSHLIRCGMWNLTGD
jgi:hypothetical protein